MKSARFLFLFSLFLTFTIFTIKVSAQSSDLSKPNQNWQCIEAKRVGGHSVELSTKTANQFPPPGSDVYIVECLSTNKGTKCTTGECAADTDLVGNCNDLRFLQSQMNYQRSQFSGTQPSKSNYEGKVGPFTWQSDLKKTVDHTFFGVGVSEAVTVGEGQWPSLQLGTFYFPNSSESCKGASFRWDPYGRVFDSVSLEPISNAVVTLFSKVNNVATPVSLPGLTNPQQTAVDGIFNFVVPDGTYVLRPQISTHTYPNNPSKLNPNYSRAYFDIYRGQDIVQAGFIQHRDIPMDPVGTPFIGPAKVLDYSITLDKLNSKLLISGTVSHPLSKVKVFSGVTFIKQVTADKFGAFGFSLNSASIDQSQIIRLEVYKTDLVNSNPQVFLKNPILNILKPAFAQDDEATVIINPIMNNIEGYAFDDEGNIVQNGTVTVYLSNSNKPFYSVKTDNIGFFRIPSQFLPPLSYFLEIKSSSGKITNVETTDFASKNAKYAKAASVNYGVYNPQVPGTIETAETDANITTTPEGKTVKTVIGPDGKVITVSTETGEVINETEEGQIVTANEVTDTSVTPNPQTAVVAAESRKIRSLLIVLIICFISALVVIYLYFKLRTKNSK